MKINNAELEKCMLLSQKAYKGKYGTDYIPFEKKLTKIQEYKLDEVQVYTCLDFDKNFYIVFRGSSGLDDWVSNLDFFMDKIGEYKFHGGHLKQWLKVEYLIHDIIKKEYLLANNIYITGHSLGGSLAEIAGFRVTKLFPYIKQKLKIYSFGANANMGFKTKLWFDKNVYCVRTVNGDDIVPKLPPLKNFKFLKKISFYHPAKKLKIGRKEKWYYCFRIFTNVVKDIKDHYPTQYIKSIQKREKK